MSAVWIYLPKKTFTLCCVRNDSPRVPVVRWVRWRDGVSDIADYVRNDNREIRCMVCVKGVIASDLFPAGVNGNGDEMVATMDKEEGKSSVRLKDLRHVGTKVSCPFAVVSVGSAGSVIGESNNSCGEFIV